MTEFTLDEHHVRLLTLAAEAWDRAQQARERIAADGAYPPDGFGQLRTHPAIAVERDARIAFARSSASYIWLRAGRWLGELQAGDGIRTRCRACDTQENVASLRDGARFLASHWQAQHAPARRRR